MTNSENDNSERGRENFGDLARGAGINNVSLAKPDEQRRKNRSQNSSRPEAKRVLILALSGIGNFLMQSPTIEALKKSHPNWHITVWVAPRGTRSLAKHSSAIDEIIEEPIKRSLWKHLRLILKFRQYHFDLGLVLSPGQLIKSSLYLWLAGIPKRVGHRYPLFGRKTKLFLTDAISEDPTLHDIEQNLNLLQLLGISHKLSASTADPPTWRASYKLPVPLSSQRRADELVSKFHIPTSKRLVGFHPGSAQNFLWKRWPLLHWAELGQALTDKNYHILIFGGKDETKLKRKLHARLGKNSTIIETDLLTSAALMQKCSFFVSSDSGLMHLAAAAGVKTYGLFGPTDEKQTGPRGSHSYVIRAPGTSPLYNTEMNFDLGTKPHPTLTALSPDYVLRSIAL